MKKIIYLVIIAFCILAYAEGVQAQGVGVGIKGGVNFANVDISDISTDSYTGWHAGAYITIALSDKFAIQPEVLWEAKGSKFQFEVQDPLDETKKLNYVSIPVLFRWKPINFFSVETGPQFGFLTGAEAGDVDIKDRIKSSDFSWDFGATVHLPLGLKAGGRYILGLSNINEFDISDVDVKNRTFQVFVAWTIFGAK